MIGSGIVTAALGAIGGRAIRLLGWEVNVPTQEELDAAIADGFAELNRQADT